MTRDLHPTEGARYLLERASDDGGRATYRAAIYTPTDAFTAVATLHDDGTVELPPTGAPSELDDRLTSIAKLLARDARKRRDDGLVPWPTRLLRWRK